MANDECHTPDEFYKKLDKVFKFKLDAAATKKNAKCKKYYTKKDDALKKNWSCRGWVWCNPPYSREGGGILAWVKRAYAVSSFSKGVVLLCICDVSTKTRGFAWEHANEIVELTPRINFMSPGKTGRSGGLQAYQLIIFTDEYRGSRKMSRWDWKNTEFSERLIWDNV